MSLLDADVPSSPAISYHSVGPERSQPVTTEQPMSRIDNGTAPKRQHTLFLKAEMNEPQSLACANGTALVFSRPSPLKDTGNEDAAAVLPLWDGTAVLIVADGVGGMKAGNKASASAVRAIRKSVDRAPKGSDLRTFIVDGIERANENILKNAAGSATTVAIAEISDGYMRPYHVGDSIILQIGNRGQVKWSALSHAPLSYAVESGLMSEEDAMIHPERNLISNIVGDRDMTIEIGPRRKLAQTDTIVLASDGLCDNLSSHEIADFARRSPLPVRTEQMIAEARNRMYLAIEGRAEIEQLPGKPDDLTVIVYRRETQRKSKKAPPKAQQPEAVIERVTVTPPPPIEAPPNSLILDYT